MAYSEAILRRARARLAEAKEDRAHEDARRIEAIYTAQPRLREIDRELRATVARVMTAAFRHGEDPAEAVAKLREQNLALQRERAWILESEGIDESDLSATPVCALCGGSGYVGARMCECLHELCRQEQKKELTSLLNGRGSFETFRLDCYPAAFDPNLGASPREQMELTLRRCRRYAQDFSPRSPSMLFCGGTGLGKTFLSAAIARTVADRGFSVVYESAGRVFSDFERARFDREPALAAKYMACDLMILDDLGSEMTTRSVLEALYTLLNGRILAPAPVIVSTNLTADEIRQRYTPQIYSRLLGTCELLLFAGEDIRMQQRP